MAFNVNTSISAHVAPENVSKQQSSSENLSSNPHNKLAEQTGKPVNDNISLSQSAEVKAQKVASESSIASSTAVEESPVLSAQEALKALHQVQNAILQKADVAIQSQANNNPEAVFDLLANTTE